MRTLPLSAAVFALLFALQGYARPATTLRVSVQSHPVIGGASPMPRVVFDDEDLIVDVTLNVVAIPDEVPSDTPASSLQLPVQWWRSLRWSLREANGRDVPLSIDVAQVVREDEGARARQLSQNREGIVTVRIGDRPRVVLNLGRLGRGDYAVQVALDRIKSAEYRFAVRNGSESPEIHRAYLHYQLTLPHTYEQARAFLLELSSLEPKNAALFEDLGVLAIQNGRRDDAEYAFRHATTIIEGNRIGYRRSQSTDAVVEKEFDKKLGELAAIRRMVPRYFANRDSLRLDIRTVMGRREYSLVRRDTGELLERVR